MKVTDDLKIASIFNTNFTSNKIPRQYRKEQKLMKMELRRQKQNKHPHLISTERIFYEPFNQSELNSAINKMNSNKAPGPDKIFPEFIKHLGTKAKAVLLNFYNYVWKTSVPAGWKKAVIIPVLKPGKSANDITNYRPISLTSHLAKIMERMISTRLNWFLETHNLLSPSQAGFRRNHSTNEQVILLSQDIKEAFNNKEDTLAVFVDLKSAYDNVWRCNLIRKLQQMGITGNMLRWISEFVGQRYCATSYGTATSRYKQTHLGLPQGAVLSTTLFNIYINDLPQQAEKVGVKTALFADDLIIWSSQKTNKTEKLKTKIQTALEELESWCKNNLMNVNTTKTNFQLFSLRKTPVEIILHYGDTILQRTENAKYLGVYFDKKLTWKDHIEYLTKKATNRFKLLKRLAGTKWGSSRKTLNTTYNIYIKPVLKYCGEILISSSNTNKELLEHTQNQALHLITGAVKTTPIAALQAITSNKPIMLELETQALLTYEKLIRLQNSDKWNKYQNSKHTLKTQNGFIQEAIKFSEKLFHKS